MIHFILLSGGWS